MKLYAGNPFSTFIETRERSIMSDIESQSDSYILNVSIDDLAAHLTQKFEIDTPHIDFAAVSVDSDERDISGSRFPRYDFMGIDTGKSYRKEVIIYHLPYSGDLSILQYRPNPFSMVYPDIQTDSRRNIIIEVINFYNDPKKIKYEYDQAVRDITSNYEALVSSCNVFNSTLPQRIKSMIEARKQKVMSKNSLIASLGVPLKQKADTPQTFSVPKPKLKEKIIIAKPTVKDRDFKPEPTLDGSNFNKILKIINDVGQNLERLPSTYKGKGEEDIRDYILMTLDPNFELGSASGETFNKTGKTDICLRYDSSVVFVAECKFWKGEKTFLKTIDQLLGYLTWRNSKVAIINFVQNLEFSDVLAKVKSSITTHPNFLKYDGDTTDTWFNYKFHINGDRNREIDLTVISFHLPK